MSSAEVLRLVIAVGMSSLASITITALTMANKYATRIEVLENTIELKFAEVYRRLDMRGEARD